METTTYDPTPVPEQELEPQPLGPTVPDVQDTQDTQENQEPAAPATVQADSDSAAAPVMTMAIGILIGLLAAILVVLIVIAARKKK